MQRKKKPIKKNRKKPQQKLGKLPEVIGGFTTTHWNEYDDIDDFFNKIERKRHGK